MLDVDKGILAAREQLVSLLDRLHVLIIGPGLGRDEFMQSCAREALLLAKEREVGIVIDADGLWLINSEYELIKAWEGVPRIVLTPNIIEFGRLAAGMVGNKSSLTAESTGRVLRRAGAGTGERHDHPKRSRGCHFQRPGIAGRVWRQGGSARRRHARRTKARRRAGRHSVRHDGDAPRVGEGMGARRIRARRGYA